MMRILITGCTGFVGEKLLQFLSKLPDLSLLATARNQLDPKLKGPFSFQFLDIRNSAQVSAVLDSFRPDVVFNTAAMSGVDTCEKYKDECWETNVNSLKSIVSGCNKLNAHLIHFSTDFVFDGTHLSYTEEDQTAPVNYYGLSKQESEKIVLSEASKASIVRTILVYGQPVSASKSNVVLWVRKNLESQSPIKVVEDNIRMPTLVEDLIEGCYQIMLRQKTGIYHLSGFEPYSIYEIALQVADFFGLDRSLISPVNASSIDKVPRPKITGFDIHKAYLDLEFKPRSFRQGLESIQSAGL